MIASSMNLARALDGCGGSSPPHAAWLCTPTPRATKSAASVTRAKLNVSGIVPASYQRVGCCRPLRLQAMQFRCSSRQPLLGAVTKAAALRAADTKCAPAAALQFLRHRVVFETVWSEKVMTYAEVRAMPLLSPQDMRIRSSLPLSAMHHTYDALSVYDDA